MNVTVEQFQDRLNQPLDLKNYGVDESFSKEALQRIKKAIGAQSIKIDGIVAESKQRRRIIYRGKK